MSNFTLSDERRVAAGRDGRRTTLSSALDLRICTIDDLALLRVAFHAASDLLMEIGNQPHTMRDGIAALGGEIVDELQDALACDEDRVMTEMGQRVPNSAPETLVQGDAIAAYMASAGLS